MADLRSKPLIVAKGVMFASICVLAAAALYLRHPDATTLMLVVLVAWSAARTYYFAFYVLERYVDSRLRYAGLLALAQQLLRNRRRRPRDP